MLSSKPPLFVICLLLCAPWLSAQQSGSADAAARDAARRLDAALSGTGTATSPPVQSTRGGREPAWVNDPYAAYSRDRYIAAVGYGADRAEAERRAFANLTALFGQSVRAETSIATAYSEAISQGIISVSENTRVRDEVATAASLDTLIGAEIGGVWDNARGMVYAAARMDKERTVAVYTDMILVNQQIIDRLTNLGAAQRNTLDGYARYSLAAGIAAINTKYASVVTQAGGSTASLNLRGAESYSLTAREIIGNITVAVQVNGDQDSRIQGVFAKALSDKGLRTRGTNPPYTLVVDVAYNEAVFPNNPNKFCRYTISANLTENATRASLLPFTFTGRSGRPTYEEARTMAVRDIERTIAETFPAALDEYLATLLPRK